MLPQTTVLVGNHSTLWRWLLPEWNNERSPSARDIAKAASEMGVPYTLVTGVPLPDQFVDNVLATPQTRAGQREVRALRRGVLRRRRHAVGGARRPGRRRRRPAAAAGEALAYLDRCLDGGFRPAWATWCPTASSGRSRTDDGDEDGGRPLRPAEKSTAPTPKAPARKPVPRRPTITRKPMTTDKNQTCSSAPARHSPAASTRRCAPSAPSAARRAYRAARARRLLLGRRRRALHRLHRLLGPDDPRPRPPARARGRAEGGDDGLSFGAPTEREIELAEEIVAARALGGDGAPGELGHRGGDERHPPGARRHRPQPRSSSSRAATTATPTRCW